jgi:tetratricopeptide (TPR) repeat protein
VQAALGDVVLLEVDCEQGAGIDLAKTHTVTGYPTFVLVNAGGATLDRWAGYGKDFFLETLADGLSDPTTIAEKRARYEAAPTVRDAARLARYHDSLEEYREAVALYRAIQELDPGQDRTYDIFRSIAYGHLEGEQYTLDEVRAAADVAVASEGISPGDLGYLVRLARYVGRRAGEPRLFVPYLEPALAATRDSEDPDVQRTHASLQVDHALLIEGDALKAVALKRETYAEGWQDDSSQLNSFAWWCFENRVNLEEAETLAAKGVELAEPGKARGQILDTLAEILAAQGKRVEAAAAMERAVAEAPDEEHFRNQLERFSAPEPGGT